MNKASTAEVDPEAIHFCAAIETAYKNGRKNPHWTETVISVTEVALQLVWRGRYTRHGNSLLLLVEIHEYP
jgi:hypothetical protein